METPCIFPHCWPLPAATSPPTCYSATPVLSPSSRGALRRVTSGLQPVASREGRTRGLMDRGSSNKLIARELDIAETTVKIHVQHILRKLGLSSRVQAAVYAAHHGLS